MKPVDRELVERLLEDDSLSFREIGRQADCSDWTVRSIARGIAGDSRPMKSARRAREDAHDDAPASGGWVVFVAFVAAVAALIWFAARRAPLDGGPMP